MAVKDPRGKKKKAETPGLFDYLDRMPAVKIGGVDPAYLGSADFEDENDPAPQTPIDDFDDPDDAEEHFADAISENQPDADASAADEDEIEADDLDEDEPEEDQLPPADAVKTAKTKNVQSETPVRRTRSSRKNGAKVTAESLASGHRDISVSEFFAKNRHLLGFDNKRKALLTTVKEAVDNSLDACEEANILPDLHIEIIQIADDRFRVRVRDNGPGIVKSQVPNVFGKLLYGSKFHRLKMSRGQQGIGISAAGMYGMLTTGKSVHVTSRTSPKKPAHHFQIQIDTAKNRPDIIHDEEVAVDWECGTEVTIELIASYAKGKQSVDEYIEQTAIANPHASITYTSPTREHRDFPRGSEELPDETREIQPHPHGIELGVLMKLLKESKGHKLSGFLQQSFCRVSQTVAEKICKSAGLSSKAAPNSIGTHEVEKLYEAIQSVKIMAPPTDCLAPIGVRALLAGLLKEVKAEFYTAVTRSPAVYRGNPFQIEIALAYGGKLDAEGSARIIRFANRVPLMYQQSACAAFKSVLEVDWRNYGLSRPSGGLPVGPLVVMVHMASVWVPFTSESKEAIADYDEIRKEMRLALQECGRKLASYVRRRRRQKLEAQKRDIFSRYIPDVADALSNLTGAGEDRILKELRALAQSRTAEADVVLDEDGKPIEQPDEAEAADEPVLNGDDSTVIVPENEAEIVPEDLFEENGNGGNGKRKRSKRKK